MLHNNIFIASKDNNLAKLQRGISKIKPKQLRIRGKVKVSSKTVLLYLCIH